MRRSRMMALLALMLVLQSLAAAWHWHGEPRGAVAAAVAASCALDGASVQPAPCLDPGDPDEAHADCGLCASMAMGLELPTPADLVWRRPATRPVPPAITGPSLASAVRAEFWARGPPVAQAG